MCPPSKISIWIYVLIAIIVIGIVVFVDNPKSKECPAAFYMQGGAVCPPAKAASK